MKYLILLALTACTQAPASSPGPVAQNHAQQLQLDRIEAQLTRLHTERETNLTIYKKAENCTKECQKTFPYTPDADDPYQKHRQACFKFCETTTPYPPNCFEI
jgi:hypothetical protein